MSRLQGVTDPGSKAKIEATIAKVQNDRDDLEKEIYELDAPIKLLVVDLETPL